MRGSREGGVRIFLPPHPEKSKLLINSRLEITKTIGCPGKLNYHSDPLLGKKFWIRARIGYFPKHSLYAIENHITGVYLSPPPLINLLYFEEKNR